jgi:hypothetical protein
MPVHASAGSVQSTSSSMLPHPYEAVPRGQAPDGGREVRGNAGPGAEQQQEQGGHHARR